MYLPQITQKQSSKKFNNLLYWNKEYSLNINIFLTEIVNDYFDNFYF